MNEWPAPPSPGADDGDDRPDPRIGVFAAPARYPRTPIIALVIIALVPAVGLVAVERWARGEADDYDRARAEIEAASEVDPASTRAPETYLPIDAPIPSELDGTQPDGDGEEGDGEDGGSFPSSGGDSDTDADGDDTGANGDDTGADSDDTDDEAESVEPERVAPGGLTSSLLELRRAPTAIIDRRNADLLGNELDLALPFYGDRSCVAVSVNGLPVADHNPDLPVIPASVQKLIVAAVALDVLGGDFRYRTELYGPAPDADGVINGDVHLVGGGDPLLVTDDFDLSVDTYPAFATTSLDLLVARLVGDGVTRIEGAVLGDGRRYDDEFFVDRWGEGVAGVDAGPYDALMVNDARGARETERTPSADAARQLDRLLAAAGITVVGISEEGSYVPSPSDQLLATADSAPLTRIVDEMLRTSDNNTAELVLKEIGFATTGSGTRQAGLEVVGAQLDEWKVPRFGVNLVDGSGLSPENRVTCTAVLQVLQRSTDAQLQESVPVAGRSGTLVEEFVDTDVEGTLRAKTGTLGNPPEGDGPPAVKGLAGWLPRTGERTIEFVVLLNDDEAVRPERYRQLWRALTDRLMKYPSGPTGAELGLGDGEQQ